MNSRQTNCQLEQMWGSTKISSQICLFAYFLCPPPACHRDGQFDSHETCAPASAQPCGCVVCSATHIISQLSLDSIFSCHSNHKSLICTGRGWPPICAVSRKQTIHDRPMILVYSIYSMYLLINILLRRQPVIVQHLQPLSLAIAMPWRCTFWSYLTSRKRQ